MLYLNYSSTSSPTDFDEKFFSIKSIKLALKNSVNILCTDYLLGFCDISFQDLSLLDNDIDNMFENICNGLIYWAKENIRLDKITYDKLECVHDLSAAHVPIYTNPALIVLPDSSESLSSSSSSAANKIEENIVIHDTLTTNLIKIFKRKLLSFAEKCMPEWLKYEYCGLNSISSPLLMSKILKLIFDNDLKFKESDEQSNDAKIGVNFNSMSGINDFLYYNYALEYKMIGFIHNNLNCIYVKEFQKNILQCFPMKGSKVDGTEMLDDITNFRKYDSVNLGSQTRFYCNATKNDCGDFNQIARELSTTPTYVYLVEFFTSGYCKEYQLLILLLISTMKKLRHVICDVDPKTFKEYVTEVKLVQEVMFVENSSKVWYYFVDMDSAFLDNDKLELTHNKFPVTQPNDICYHNIMTQLDWQDLNYLAGQLNLEI